MEARVKRVRHVENGEETSESVSNDAVVASLGRSVSGHPRVGENESDFPEQKDILARNGSTKTTVK